MDDNRAVELLRQTAFFSDFDDGTLRKILEGSVRRSYEKGDLLFHEGDRGDSLFVLLSGLVKVLVTSAEGDQMLLVTLGPPATFGELALVDGLPRSASVEALEESHALIVSRQAWTALLETHPSLQDALLRTLASTLRRLTEQAADLVFLDLHGRIAKLLVRYAEERSPEAGAPVLDLRMTQGDVARMVGGSRQSVNQILHGLEERGYLELQGRKIVIRRLDLLRRRAGLEP